MRTDNSTPGGRMGMIWRYTSPDSIPTSAGANPFLKGVIIIVLLIILLQIFWSGKNYLWQKHLRRRKESLKLREESISNREEEFQDDRLMWNQEHARLVMESEALKEVVEKLGKMKIDNANDATTVSEYLGMFKDMNTGTEHLTTVILYGEEKLEILLDTLFRLEPDNEIKHS